MLGVGFHFAGAYVGATMYADDLVLMASITFVPNATHLGHELTQACMMELDCKIKRADYIDKTVNIRETFSFAEPEQILQAVEKYCCDYYGAMLWQLDSHMAGQFFRCWSTCVKLVYDVPRATHTYFVDNLLAASFLSLRQQIILRYAKFVRGLLSSPSTEVALVANIVAHDMGSNTGQNMAMIRRDTQLNPWEASPVQVRDNLPSAVVPQPDKWRLTLLQKYIAQRRKMEINSLISSLCIN